MFTAATLTAVRARALQVALRVLRDPEEAAEVAQEVLLRLLTHPEVTNPRAFASAVAFNLALDLHRRSRRSPVRLTQRRHNHAGDALPDEVEAAVDPHHARARAHLEARADLHVLRALAQTPSDRQLFDDTLAGLHRDDRIRLGRPGAEPGDPSWATERDRLLKAEHRALQRVRARLHRDLKLDR